MHTYTSIHSHDSVTSLPPKKHQDEAHKLEIFDPFGAQDFGSSFGSSVVQGFKGCSGL